MTFIRENLPDARAYFEDAGLKLTGPRNSKWQTARCDFHGGSDSMRINLESGGWCCMACGKTGGDVLAYEIAITGACFIDAAKALGCWAVDGKPAHTRPAPLSPRDALSVLKFETILIAIAAGNVGHGVVLTEIDKNRVLQAAGRINMICEAYQ